MKLIRRLPRPSPALVVACVSLVVALGGVSYAAVTLPKNSVGSRQIRKGAVVPSKLNKRTLALFGKQSSVSGTGGGVGASGQNGQPGPKGDTGPKGEQGPPGPFPDVLPGGKTVRGAYALFAFAAASGDQARTAISYGYAVPAAATPHFIAQGSGSTADCPGNFNDPAAAPGQLCVYEDVTASATPVKVLANRKFGAVLAVDSTSKSVNFGSSGAWAVTGQ